MSEQERQSLSERAGTSSNEGRTPSDERERLSTAQLEKYARDGLVSPNYTLPRALSARLLGATEWVLANNPEVPPDRLINVHVTAPKAGAVKGHEAFFELVQHPVILDMVEQILGPDLVLWSSHLFCKPPGVGREVPWHQDAQYWPITPSATCSVWVALDDVSIENGAMRYVPGSHTGQIFRHHTDHDQSLTLNQVLDPGQFDEASVRYDELPAGRFSMHHVNLVHGSAANRSTRRRAGVALRYMPATSKLERDRPLPNARTDWANLPLLLVRGWDRAGNDFTIGH